MKEIFEEYGGVVSACITAVIIIGAISALVSQDGSLHNLAALYFEGIGTTGK